VLIAMAINQNSKANSNKDIYQSVTDRMIAALEAGTVPWKSPYLGTSGLPENFVTRKAYRGINVWLLALAGYASPFWLTFKQAQELGGYVRKGEKGSLVVKYGTFEAEDEDSGEVAERMYLKGYTVFNAAQIEGIEFPLPEKRTLPLDTCSEARRILAAMPNPPTLKHGTSTAFYSPAEDTVFMPNMEDITSPETYFLTSFHEHCHSSGALHRLNRKSLVENKGMHASRQVYAEEELVAEMGAAFLGAHAGIFEDQSENSAAYLAGWLKALKGADAKTWIIRAASQAQKAADYILGSE
ncbi:MAG: ArdC-like ssDNA-binding domain-containing protein, partial [Alphaproteobacteria bacterium]